MAEVEKVEEVLCPLIDLQKWLNDLSNDNYPETKKLIVNSNFTKDDDKLRILIDEFLTINLIRHNSIELYIDLITSLQSAGSSKNVLVKLKQMLYTELMNLPQYTCPAPNLMFLRRCASKNVYTIDQILKTVIKYPASEDNTYPYVFITFAPELDSLQNKYYKTNSKRLSKYRVKSPMLRKCINTYSLDLRRDHYRILGQMFQDGYEDICLQHVLKFDDSAILEQYIESETINYTKLLENGAFDIITCNFMKLRLTPVEMAAMYGAEKCFTLIYEKSVKSNNLAKYSVMGGNMTIVQMLDKDGVSFSNALGAAAAYRHEELFDWILAKSPSQEDLDKALDEAARFNNAAALLKLLKAGAKPRMFDDKKTIEKSDIHKKSLEKLTTSSIAAARGHVEILRALYAFGAGNLQVDASAAAQWGKLPTLRYLIEWEGADPITGDSRGLTPLHYAAIGGAEKVIDYLINQRGADPNCRDNWRRYPLHYACLNNHISAVKSLLLKGAETSGEDVDGIGISEMASSEDVQLFMKTAKEMRRERRNENK